MIDKSRAEALAIYEGQEDQSLNYTLLTSIHSLARHAHQALSVSCHSGYH